MATITISDQDFARIVRKIGKAVADERDEHVHVVMLSLAVAPYSVEPGPRLLSRERLKRLSEVLALAAAEPEGPASPH